MIAFALLLTAVDFQKEVKPILSNACFSCHGFDAKSRMAGLRLDSKEGAFSIRRSGAVIVPGKPDASLLLQRVLHTDPARQMPPSYSHKSLTAAQKDTLRRWIAEGAPWKEHWSFRAPERPALPAGAAANPIDRFIAAKLAASGLDVDTVEALLNEKDLDEVHASNVKNALKRRRPDFIESAYGYKAFGKILEDAEKRGLLAIHRHGQAVAVSLPR